jgi:hypothetical protein
MEVSLPMSNAPETTSGNPLHPKRAGSSVEAVVINAEPQLTFVDDSDAEWHDARTTGLFEPTHERPFDGLCLVEVGTPVEIKATLPEHQNGERTAPGRWYIKRPSHERLVDANGVYHLNVYAPRPSTPLLASVVVAAATIDDLLTGYWYQNRGRDVARLSWPRVIDENRVTGGGN